MMNELREEEDAEEEEEEKEEEEEEEEEKEDNLVLCYKPQGTSGPALYQLHKESFMVLSSSVLAQPHFSQ